jgi:hypothetical protein
LSQPFAWISTPSMAIRGATRNTSVGSHHATDHPACTNTCTTTQGHNTLQRMRRVHLALLVSGSHKLIFKFSTSTSRSKLRQAVAWPSVRLQKCGANKRQIKRVWFFPPAFPRSRSPPPSRSPPMLSHPQRWPPETAAETGLGPLHLVP